MTNYYELLSVQSSATQADIRRAFRQEISRYHPDKVHHLGKEFQEMAATRAAQLTEAYRTLMNGELRAEYDRLLDTIQALPGSAAPQPEPSGQPAPPEPSPPPSSSHPEAGGVQWNQFSEERSTKDEFVRKATLGRLRKVLAEFGAFSEVAVLGFDLVCATTKTRLFGKSRVSPNLFVRLVREVNSAAIHETWNMASKALNTAGGEAWVLLLGPVPSHRDAREAVAALKGHPGRAAKALTLVPVDLRDWSADIPPDVPRHCRSILEKLKNAT